MWALYALFPTPNVTLSEVVFATFIIMSRNTIIAAKYAYASPGQLSDMQKRRFSPEEIAAWLLVSGWAIPSPTTQRNEILYALKRTQIDVRHMRLHFAADDPSEQEAIVADLRASFGPMLSDPELRPPGYMDDWEKDLAGGSVPGELVVHSLVAESVRASASSVKLVIRFSLFAGLVHALIPSFVRAFEGRPFLGEGVEYAVTLGAAVTSFPNVVSSILFVLVGVIDYNRRVWLMHQCSAMLSPQYRIFQTSRSTLLPLLAMDHSVNIAHWLDLRTIFKDFG